MLFPGPTSTVAAGAELCRFPASNGGAQMPTTAMSTSTRASSCVRMLTPRDGAGLADFPPAAWGRDASPRSESRLADFCAAGISSTSEEDFDVMIKQMWNEHLSQLPPKVAETKKWRSGYWKNWNREIVLDSDDPVVGEPDVSDRAASVLSSSPREESLSALGLWSIEGSPPVADDARRGRPAEQDQRRQGGRPEAKPQLPDGPA